MTSFADLDSEIVRDIIRDLLNKKLELKLEVRSDYKFDLLHVDQNPVRVGVVCEIKSANISDFDLLNSAFHQSDAYLNQFDLRLLYIVVLRSVTSSVQKDLLDRFSDKKRSRVRILDLDSLNRFLNEEPAIRRKYFKEMISWSEVYWNVAKVLSDFHHSNGDHSSAEIYGRLKGSEYLKFVANRLVTENILISGYDPVQIFATFSYTSVKKDQRIRIINSLFKALKVDLSYSTKEVDFEGCPSPIITQIVKNRSPYEQIRIWDMFSEVFAKGITGLSPEHFASLKDWKGLDIASLTIFLFWVRSDVFLPLDRNTVDFLIAYKIIESRPKTYESYVLCLEKINPKDFVLGQSKQVFQQIAKDAYRFSDERNVANVFSGTTASVFSKVTGSRLDRQKYEMASSQKQDELAKKFKLIAIRPFDNRTKNGKTPRYLKNLKSGTLYKFYSAFEFGPNDNKIKYDQSKDLDLYSIPESKLNISISAVVGMNGSGKSTLVELFYLIINKLSAKKEDKFAAELEDEEVFADLFVLTDKLYKISVGKRVDIVTYDEKKGKDIAIYTTMSSRVPVSKRLKDFDLERFCYSLVVNYSLYGLNTKSVGEWIYPLFHKNDSYQIPIALNPMRKEGNIDVNNEEDLSRSRLLSNLLEPELIDFKKKIVRDLVPGSTPAFLSLELDTEKLQRKRENYRKQYRTSPSDELIRKVVSMFGIDNIADVDYEKECNEYIFYKVVSVAEYSRFEKIEVRKLLQSDKELKNYVDDLKSEPSHIAFKLRQAVNYLKYGIYRPSEKESILKLSAKIEKIKNDEDVRTIDLVPPSFFKPDIHFKYGGRFQALSSGEKQQIFSINSIGYHLFNLNSVVSLPGVYMYRNVNIIFDEVELYFHPEFQRTFVSNLLERISQLDLKNIKNINILFVTHSPFILSDIPKENILMLELEKNKSKPSPPQKSTFGANIHEMLEEDFFLSSSIGAFAKGEIDKIIEFYNRLRVIDKKKLKELRKEYFEYKMRFELIVENIGEEILQGVLKNHLNYMEEYFEENK